MLGGLSALNSAHPESLDLEIDAHPHRSLPLPSLTCRQWQHCRLPIAGAGSLAALNAAGRGTWYIDGAGNACGNSGSASSTCAPIWSAVSAQLGTLATDCTAMDRVTCFTLRAQVACVPFDVPQLVDAPLRAIAPRAPGVSVGKGQGRRWIRAGTTGFFEHLGSCCGWCAPIELLTQAAVQIWPGQQTPGRQW